MVVQRKKDRQTVKVTGGTVYKNIGCVGLTHQKQHDEHVIHGAVLPTFNDEQSQAMQHGTKSEVHKITMGSMPL